MSLLFPVYVKMKIYNYFITIIKKIINLLFIIYYLFKNYIVQYFL